MDLPIVHGVLESGSGAEQQSKAESRPPIHSEINETWAEEPSHNLKSHTLQRALYGAGDPARTEGGRGMGTMPCKMPWLI